MKAQPTTRQLIEMLYDRIPELFDRPQPDSNTWTPVQIGVDITSEGVHVVGMYTPPNMPNYVFYSQVHPLAKPEKNKDPSVREAKEPAGIYYMRDNHTFKKLSADVSTALIEIEQEFNEGYTYGMLCSKREGFPNIHARGSKKRLEFFAECKKTLEEWLPNTVLPQREWVGLTDEEVFNVWLNEMPAPDKVFYPKLCRSIEAKLKEKNCEQR